MKNMQLVFLVIACSTLGGIVNNSLFAMGSNVWVARLVGAIVAGVMAIIIPRVVKHFYKQQNVQK